MKNYKVYLESDEVPIIVPGTVYAVKDGVLYIYRDNHMVASFNENAWSYFEVEFNG